MRNTLPEHLKLEEAFELFGSDDRSLFLSDLRLKLAAGVAKATGRPNGLGSRQAVSTELWREMILLFELGGCSTNENGAEHSIGAAWARRTGHHSIKPFGPDSAPVVWLDLLISGATAEMAPQVTSASKQKADASRGGRPRGVGSLRAADDTVLDQMAALIRAGKVSSPTKAAQMLVEHAAGTGIVESKVTRLVKRYNKREKSITERSVILGLNR